MKLSLELKDAYVQGRITVYQIADQLGCSPSSAYNALVKDGIDTSKYRHRLSKRNKEIVEAYKKYPNIIVVGKKFRISKQRVHQILENLAPEILNRRPRKEKQC